MKNEKGEFEMKFEKLFEIRAFDWEAEEMTSVFYTGDYSMIDLQVALGNDNMELDEYDTLRIHLGVPFAYEHILDVLNSQKIMDTPLNELFRQGKIHELVKEQA